MLVNSFLFKPCCKEEESFIYEQAALASFSKLYVVIEMYLNWLQSGKLVTMVHTFHYYFSFLRVQYTGLVLIIFNLNLNPYLLSLLPYFEPFFHPCQTYLK